MKKRISKWKENTNLLLIINIIISVLILVFGFSLSSSLVDKDTNSTSLFLGLTLLFNAVYNLFLLIKSNSKKARIRYFIVFISFLIAAAMGFAARYVNILFYVATFIFVFVLSMNQFLKLSFYENKPNIAQKITYIILGSMLVLLCLGIWSGVNHELSYLISVLVVALSFVIAMKNLIEPSLKFDKMRLFVSIMFKTHLFDVLICLLALMIGFSFLLPRVDSAIPTFWDAMWYCFVVVTTIGFGDYVSTTFFGRIISVVLGMYGIVVVAIITSVIVNFYNAVMVKENEIKKEINKEKNK